MSYDDSREKLNALMETIRIFDFFVYIACLFFRNPNPIQAPNWPAQKMQVHQADVSYTKYKVSN